MCPVDKIAACEISFLPIESRNYSEDVKQVLSIIERSGLEYSVGVMSTFIRGRGDTIFDLLNEIYVSMDEACSFSMVVKISNLCGCAVR